MGARLLTDPAPVLGETECICRFATKQLCQNRNASGWKEQASLSVAALQTAYHSCGCNSLVPWVSRLGTASRPLTPSRETRTWWGPRLAATSNSIQSGNNQQERA